MASEKTYRIWLLLLYFFIFWVFVITLKPFIGAFLGILLGIILIIQI